MAAEPTVRVPGIVLASLMFHHLNSDSDVVRITSTIYLTIYIAIRPAWHMVNISKTDMRANITSMLFIKERVTSLVMRYYLDYFQLSFVAGE